MGQDRSGENPGGEGHTNRRQEYIVAEEEGEPPPA